MSPPHYVGYDDDPLPPDRFRMSFGPPKRKPKRQPEPVSAPPPRPVLVPPRPQVVAPMPPPPVAQPAAMAAPMVARALPARPPAAPRPVRLLRPQLEPRGQAVHSFPTWKPQAAPVVRLPAHPVAAVAEATRALTGGPLLALRLVASLLLLAPLGWFGGWFALPPTAADFLMTGLGRTAWRTMGGPDALLLYWALLFPPALALTFLRPLAWPLLGLGLLFWGWTGLHHALGAPAPWVPW